VNQPVLGPMDRPIDAPRSEPMLREVVGNVLRSARLAQGRTLKDVAREAGVSVPYLSEIERGRKEASSEIVGAICRALGLRLLDLVARTAQHLAITSAPLAVGSEPVGRPAHSVGFNGSALALAA
jgi:transcriptional regulator with XRE-family HTH domain